MLPGNKLFIKMLFILTLCFNMAFTLMDISMPTLHKVVSTLQYLAFFVVLYYWFTKRKEFHYQKNFICFIVFYLVYSFVVYRDLTTNKMFELEDMLGCPSTLKEFLYNTFIILALMFFIPILSKIKDYHFLFNSFIFINGIGTAVFCILKGHQEIGEYALMISGLASAVALMAILFRKKILLSSRIKIIPYVFVATSVFVWAFCSKRGPVLYFLTSALLLYILGNRKNVSKILLSLSIVGILIFAFQSIIFDLTQDIAPELVDKFKSTFESGDTSGRFGDEDSGYALAYEQILGNIWTGTYFRITYPFGIWTGMYPHNIVLESMMTFGLLGTIPLFVFVFLAVKRIYLITNMKKNNTYWMMMFFTIIFLNSFLMLMSTGTLLLNKSFWLSFGALLNFKPIKNDKFYICNTSQEFSPLS